MPCLRSGERSRRRLRVPRLERLRAGPDVRHCLVDVRALLCRVRRQVRARGQSQHKGPGHLLPDARLRGVPRRSAVQVVQSRRRSQLRVGLESLPVALRQRRRVCAVRRRAARRDVSEQGGARVHCAHVPRLRDERQVQVLPQQRRLALRAQGRRVPVGHVRAGQRADLPRAQVRHRLRRPRHVRVRQVLRHQQGRDSGPADLRLRGRLEARREGRLHQAHRV
jgi:hypothetical protein